MDPRRVYKTEHVRGADYQYTHPNGRARPTLTACKRFGTASIGGKHRREQYYGTDNVCNVREGAGLACYFLP